MGSSCGLLLLPLKTATGKYYVAEVYGIDEQTLLGMPKLLEGNPEDLHREGAVVIDSISAEKLLATILPDGKKIPLKIGDELEINGSRAVIVGLEKQPTDIFHSLLFLQQIANFNNLVDQIAYNILQPKPAKTLISNTNSQQIDANKNVLGLTRKQLKANC